MKYILITLLVACTSFVESSVFLCNSKGATKYHYTENCRGLNNCKHEIIKVSVKEAKERGKGLCGWED